MQFYLYEYMDVENLVQSRDRFKEMEHSRDTIDQMIEASLAIAEEQFASHGGKSDCTEPSWDGETVSIIPEVKEALDVFNESGFASAAADAKWGGMQLPHVVATALMLPFYTANVGTSTVPLLTVAAANLIERYATEELKGKYLTPMFEGRFSGTMNLSEPNAGSALGDIKTRATPTEETGTYKISGSKMWISGGEHELTENIVHLVLAKVHKEGEGVHPGVKGISLFIVPRYMDDGTANDVRLAGLNHKMGWRGITNTVMSYGENGGAIGYLVGEEGRGLACMFAMMNEARVSIGLCASALGYAGYAYSLDYAKGRLQGRLPSNKDPVAPQVPIIQHMDVKRMLLSQKAAVEGSLALCLYSAFLVDEEKTSDQPEEATLLLDMLTPVTKSWPSEWCLEANKWAIQVLGGYGYTRDYPVERFYRDNRLNMIHEGTNGIQSLDLLGRKVFMKNGEGFELLCRKILETAAEAQDSRGDVKAHASLLQEALQKVRTVTEQLSDHRGNPDVMLCNSHEYLNMVGHVVLAWVWLKQSIAAEAGLKGLHGEDDSSSEVSFYEGKLHTAKYFFRHELPKIHTQAALISSMDDSNMSMKPEWY
jgi:butyryl-CoA dehydrogenase